MQGWRSVSDREEGQGTRVEVAGWRAPKREVSMASPQTSSYSGTRSTQTRGLSEYFDDAGGCHVAIFGGPAAERMARDYYEALLAGRIPYIDLVGVE